MMLFVESYLEEMAQTKSALTVKNHRSTLNKFYAFTGEADPVGILSRDVMHWKKQMLATGKEASCNTHLKRLKMFFNCLVEGKILDSSPAEDIGLVTEAEAVPKWLTKQQRDSLLRAVKKDSIGSHLSEKKKSYRDYAMVFLMLQTGLRISELINLKWSDVELGERKGKILIRGKFGQQREVMIVSDVLGVMKHYKHHDGLKGPYVFYSQKNDQISPRRVQTLLGRYEEIIGGELTPHMLRHTFAHDLISGGMQLEAVARLMGHIKKDGTPNISQTIRYTKASIDEIGDQMESILSIG